MTNINGRLKEDVNFCHYGYDIAYGTNKTRSEI